MVDNRLKKGREILWSKTLPKRPIAIITVAYLCYTYYMLLNTEKRIYIPHLNYVVYLKDIFSADPIARRSLNHYIALTEKTSYNSCTVYFRFPITDKDLPTLCHETLHVVQYISEDYGINFAKEKEHIAYLFQYILNGFLGLVYK